MSELLLSGISKGFGSHRCPDTLKNINLHISKGEFVAVVGPSGSGKSTLLRLISGVETISSGELTIGNKVVNQVSPAKRSLAMVFQDFALYPHLNVRQNLEFGLLARKLAKQEVQDRVKWIAALLDIKSLLNTDPASLSKGEQQRVAIARALIQKTDLVLFDEPFSSLDTETRTMMRFELTRIQRQLGTTMVYVTHDQEDAMIMADRVVVLSPLEGEADTNLEQMGPPLELYQNPRNRFVAGFIGAPKMRFLRGHLLEKDNKMSLIQLKDGEQIRVAADTRYGNHGSEIVLGLRPEHLEVADTKSQGDILAQVIGVERLGADTFVYLDKNGEELVFRAPPFVKVTAQEVFSLAVNPGKTYLFNEFGVAFPRAAYHPA